MVLTSKSLVSKTALDGEYRSSIKRIDDHHWYEVSQSTRIHEIQNYGTAQQHTLDEDHGSGLIWRLLSVNRFEERDGGVYIQMEAVALSRDIPASLRWLVTPIVRRVSKESLATSLQQTSEAVSARNIVAARDGSGAKNTARPLIPAVSIFSLMQ